MLAYLFPQHADEIRAIGKEAGDSRIWAGIHFPADNVAGVELGKSVAQKFVDAKLSDTYVSNGSDAEKQYSPDTIQRYVSVLRAAWKWGKTAPGT